MSLGQATKPRSISWLRALLSVGVSAGLLLAIYTALDLDQLTALFSASDPIWFLAAALLVPVQVVLCALRWHRVSSDLSLDFSLQRAVEEYGLSVLLNQILPGGIAGDAVRVWRHKQGHGSFAAPLRAAVVERMIGQWVHLLVTALGIVLWTQVHGDAAPFGSGVAIAIVLAVFVAIWLRPPPGLRMVVADSRVAMKSAGQLVFHAVVSLALMGTLLLSFWCCSQALGLPLGWGVLTAVPLILLAMVIPLSMGGWGLREVSAAVVLGTLGWSAESAIALSAAYGLVNLVGALPAGVVLFRSVPQRTSA